MAIPCRTGFLAPFSNSYSYCCTASPKWMNTKNAKLLPYKYGGWSISRHRQSPMRLLAQHEYYANYRLSMGDRSFLRTFFFKETRKGTVKNKELRSDPFQRLIPFLGVSIVLSGLLFSDTAKAATLSDMHNLVGGIHGPMLAELDADYVDVELQVAIDFIKSMRDKKSRMCKIIVSNHNFESTPSVEELRHLVERLQSTGADIVKFTTTATNITDVARVFQVFPHSQIPIIASVISSRGLISSILFPKFGGYLMVGSLGPGKGSASGQPALTDLINIYRIKNLGKDTKVSGIIGNPVGHNKGPILHNRAFREIGLDAVYVPFLVDDLVEFLRVYSSPDFSGFSVTIPHKEAVVQCCDEVEPIAQSIGAVNTIVRRPSDGKLIGYNRDYTGAIFAIEDGDSNTQQFVRPLKKLVLLLCISKFKIAKGKINRLHMNYRYMNVAVVAMFKAENLDRDH